MPAAKSRKVLPSGIFDNRAVAAMRNQRIFAKSDVRNKFPCRTRSLPLPWGLAKHIDSWEFLFRGRNHDASKFCAQLVRVVAEVRDRGQAAQAEYRHNLLKMRDLIYAKRLGRRFAGETSRHPRATATRSCLRKWKYFICVSSGRCRPWHLQKYTTLGEFLADAIAGGKIAALARGLALGDKFFDRRVASPLEASA